MGGTVVQLFALSPYSKKILGSNILVNCGLFVYSLQVLACMAFLHTLQSLPHSSKDSN